MPHTLLLADDSVTIQRVIELTFADEDVKVVAVSTGAQAIAAMEETPPDIVLADVGMPGGNGYEVAQYIRATPRLAHTRILLLTGAFEPIDHDRAAAVGCDGVLAKPFEPQQVIARVRNLLSGAGEKPSMEVDPAASSQAPAPERREASPNARAASVDEYFDRLDHALAGVSGGSSETPRRRTLETPPAQAAAAAVRPGEVRLPSLAEAFAALLAAEQTGSQEASGTGWPAATVGPPEATVDEIVRRVLDRVGDTVDASVRATVADLVSGIAERLVREEIERIKAAVDAPDD